MTGFQNKSANETDSNWEDEGSKDIDREDLEKGQSKTKQTVSPKASQIELKQKKEGKQNFHGRYGKSLKKTQMRHNKST